MIAWSTQRPSVPGYYFWRFNAKRKHTVLNITQSHINKSDVFTMETHNIGTVVLFLEELPGEWAGPLVPPEGVVG